MSAMIERAPVEPAGAWRAEAKALVLLAGPMVLTNLAQRLFQTTDVLLLGWLGPRELAAATLGSNLYLFVLVFGMGLMYAVPPLIASERGARPDSIDDIRHTVQQAMWVVATICIPCWLLLWHSEAILIAFGQDPALAADAGRFVRALQWGLLPTLLYLALRGYVGALERPVWSLMIDCIGLVLNAVLNYGLIFGHFGLPALGLTGAGIGSAITNSLMFLGMMVVVSRQGLFRRYHLFGQFWQPNWTRYRDVWRIGLPIAVMIMFEMAALIAAVLLLGLMGSASLAAHAVAIQMIGLAFMIPFGVAQAATVRVGHAYGRGDPAGVARAGSAALMIGLAIAALNAVLMLSTSKLIALAFLEESDPANAEVIRLAAALISIAALVHVFDAAQTLCSGMLRGLQDTTVPMIYTLLGYWGIGLGAGVGLGFGLGWGAVGIWAGLSVGLFTVSVLMVLRWIRRDRLAQWPQAQLSPALGKTD